MGGDQTLTFEKLHTPYKCDESPSPRAQIRWLLKQGFAANIVDQAMLSVYEEIRTGKTFINGFILDQYLLATAKDIQKKELDDHILKLEKFYMDMRDRWEKEKAVPTTSGGDEVKKPWYKRILGA